MPKGLFIVFEGCEGSGKSTQAKLLRDRILEGRPGVVLVHEPGTTPLGNYLRSFLKSKQPLSKEAELLLFEAARAQLVSDQINPHLAAGNVVIADRFAASSIAYQGYGRKIDLEFVEKLNDFSTNRLTPQITVLLDIEPAEGLRRVGTPQLQLSLEPDDAAELARQDVEGHRRFEDQDLPFHSRVRRGYLDLAQDQPEHWLIIDASLREEEIAQLIWNDIEPRLIGVNAVNPGGKLNRRTSRTNQPLLLQ